MLAEINIPDNAIKENVTKRNKILSINIKSGIFTAIHILIQKETKSSITKILKNVFFLIIICFLFLIAVRRFFQSRSQNITNHDPCDHCNYSRRN